LKIIQHNANRQSTAQISVLQQAFKKSTHMVLFQEPSCTKTFHFVSHPAFQRIEPLQNPSKYATARPRTIAYFRRSFFPYDFSPRFDISKTLTFSSSKSTHRNRSSSYTSTTKDGTTVAMPLRHQTPCAPYDLQSRPSSPATSTFIIHSGTRLLKPPRLKLSLSCNGCNTTRPHI